MDQNRPDIKRYKKPSSWALAGFDLHVKIPKLNPGFYHLAAFRYGSDARTYHAIGAPKLHWNWGLVSSVRGPASLSC